MLLREWVTHLLVIEITAYCACIYTMRNQNSSI